MRPDLEYREELDEEEGVEGWQIQISELLQAGEIGHYKELDEKQTSNSVDH